MTGTVNIYDTVNLTRVVESLHRPSRFLSGFFFPTIQTEEGSEEIHFDVTDSKPRLAPFVHPMVAGKVVQDQGYQTKSFKPAYVKDKRVLLPNAPFKRLPGEQPLKGMLSPMQRRQKILMAQLEDQLEMLDRREEVMAAEVLRTGRVVISGEDYPTQVIDFQRDPNLTKALIGNRRWGQTGVKPVNDLEDWVTEISDKSGVQARVVVMEPRAWQIFREDETVQKLLDRDAYRGEARLNDTPMVRGQGDEKYRYVGSVGDFDFYVGNDVYVDPIDGLMKRHLQPFEVILAGQTDPATGRGGLEGARCYGNIYDEQASFVAERYFVKSWTEEDPSVRYTLMQAAPLLVPYRPNASACITVHSEPKDSGL